MDIDWYPIFQAKVTLTEMISPAYPISHMHWEGIEKVRFEINFKIII